MRIFLTGYPYYTYQKETEPFGFEYFLFSKISYAIYFLNGIQEGIEKFEVSGTLQAVLFEGAIAAELSSCSAVNEKFRYRLVSLDLLVLLYQGKRTGR